MGDANAELVEGALRGDRRSIAKVLSLVERGGEGARVAIEMLHPRTGNAWSIGITGAPGAGKSTLTDALVTRLRTAGGEVGVLAVDPTSP
ncbi:MAG: GTPase, partial [Actinomycetota bacterium]|nr:GTPase [Actinomycetota bacterium]